MKRISFLFLFPLVGVILLVFILNKQFFSLPALGVFLNPYEGVVQNEKELDFDRIIDLETKGDVEIIFDERSVPHIFSGNQGDMYFSQGYVTSCHRLWQMDFMSYVAAGRLSEIFGENYVDFDRKQRRIGLLESARQSLKLIESDVETKQVLDKYTEGVNCYIRSLSKADFPVEYKLLDYSPEKWTNLKSVLIMKYMASELTGYEEDLNTTFMYLALGEKTYTKLYSDFYGLEDPDLSFSVDRMLDSLPKAQYINYAFLSSSSLVNNNEYNPRLGSNSWAISPEKSANGSAILCNDPHLNLTLPGIWYEIQLSSDNVSAYGFSIPGTPGVIIGYNNNIAWGLTNGCADVKDWYKLKLKKDYSAYLMDGKWVKTKSIVEEIIVKNQTSFYDTIHYSIHGPIVNDQSFLIEPQYENLALQWKLSQPSNEFKTFINLMKASDHNQFKEAIRHYKCPVQNFTYADTKGNIATYYQGRIAKKTWKGQGKFILDGTLSEHLTREELSLELPFKFNPEEGYVYSANNNPFKREDSASVNGYYSEIRADKINNYLSVKKKLDVSDMKKMQLSNINHFAELALPELLKIVKEEKSEFYYRLKKWDCNYSKDDKMALFFEEWWKLMEYYTWDELRQYGFFVKNPADLILLDLIVNEPEYNYFDLVSTAKTEKANHIVLKSFREAVKRYKKKKMKSWGDNNKIQISHLAKIEAFSKLNQKSAGYKNALNALSNNWGPSLRLIVVMDEKPKGYGIYAGGQSGNPGSANYDQFIDDWMKGEYYSLNFYENLSNAKKSGNYTWIIK